MAVFPTFLEELEARTAIEDCLKRFARAVDRQDWNAARALYHPDAFDDHGFFKGPPDAFLAHIEKLHAEQLRAFLGFLVLAVAIRMAAGLLIHPQEIFSLTLS